LRLASSSHARFCSDVTVHWTFRVSLSATWQLVRDQITNDHGYILPRTSMGNDEAHALAVVGQFKCYLNDEHCTSNAESSASSSPLLQTVALAMHVTTSWSLKVKKGTHRDSWHLYQLFTLSHCTVYRTLHTHLTGRRPCKNASTKSRVCLCLVGGQWSLRTSFCLVDLCSQREVDGNTKTPDTCGNYMLPVSLKKH
jgi:hypothetical protein